MHSDYHFCITLFRGSGRQLLVHIQIFGSTKFRSPGFIREYHENLHIIYSVLCTVLQCFIDMHGQRVWITLRMHCGIPLLVVPCHTHLYCLPHYYHVLPLHPLGPLPLSSQGVGAGQAERRGEKDPT